MPPAPALERAGSAPDLLQLDLNKIRSRNQGGSEDDLSGGELTPQHYKTAFVDGLPTPQGSPEFERRSFHYGEYDEDELFVEAHQQQPPPELDSPQIHSTPISRADTPTSPALSVDESNYWNSAPGLAPGQADTPWTPHQRRRMTMLPFSLWEFLKEEIRTQDLDGSQDPKGERVSNFLMVPMQVEKMIIFGYWICFDAFLYNFTILPLRFLVATYNLCKLKVTAVIERRKRGRMRVSQKCDITKGILVILASVILQRITDASRMYHSVRGQETIKLYVIFNVLEIADRLCCSLGQDLQDSLLSRAALGRRMDGTHPHTRPTLLFGLNLAYILAHTTVLFYQLVTLNVAINSYSNALLTLLMSNQFVEIKGAVFKKFEKENVFQMSCADIVERFQLSLLLTIIVLRNLFEVSGSMFSTLPTSYINISVLPSFSVFHRIFTPAIIVLISEMVVDWLKHAFINKFNHIRPAVYGRFIDVLSKDLISPTTTSGHRPLVDQSPAVSRRLGFASIPLTCLVIRVFFQILDMLSDESHFDECAPANNTTHTAGRGWLATWFKLNPNWMAVVTRYSVLLLVGVVVWGVLVLIKLLLGIRLQDYALSRLEGIEERQKEDDRNARTRSPIGQSQAEKEADGQTSAFLASPLLDSTDRRPVKLEGNEDKRTITLENLGRFDIVKSRLY